MSLVPSGLLMPPVLVQGPLDWPIDTSFKTVPNKADKYTIVLVGPRTMSFQTQTYYRSKY